VSDPARVLPMARALATLGREHALDFGGAIDELVLEASSRACEIRDGCVCGEVLLDPHEHGVRIDARGSVSPGLEGFLDVLEARSDRAVEIVAWNAGVALALAREPSSLGPAIRRGVEDARDAIVSGRARERFEAHRAVVSAVRSPDGALTEAA
jgi:anthranilate phosphoribosyltransferase